MTKYVEAFKGFIKAYIQANWGSYADIISHLNIVFSFSLLIVKHYINKRKKRKKNK